MVSHAERNGLFDSDVTPKLVSAPVPLNCNRDIGIFEEKKRLNINRELNVNLMFF
jgi:hypothetical protein